MIKSYGFGWIRSHLLPATRYDLEQLKETIMATQAELTADLKAVLDQQKKTQVEIAAVQASVDTLKENIVALEAVIAAGGEATIELTDAVAAVKVQAQVVDDQIPDPVPLH